MREVLAGERGYVETIDGEALGLAVVHLGGGRLRQGDRIDPTVGLTDVALIGDAVTPDSPLAVIHAASDEAADKVHDTVLNAFALSPRKPKEPPLVHRSIR